MNFIFNTNAHALPFIGQLPEKDAPVMLMAEVVFGTPCKSCDGYGFCMITTRTRTFNYPCPILPCMLQYNKRTGGIKVELSKTDIDTADRKRIFWTNEWFLVEEAYLLPRHVWKKLGADQPITIPAGKYRIIKTAAGWQIMLQTTK